MTIGRIVAVVLLIAVLAGMGIALYDAGIAAGINQAVQQAAQDGQTVASRPIRMRRIGTVRRAVRRQARPDTVEQAEAVLQAVRFIELDEPMTRLAGAAEPPSLRTLDAIHLSAALAIGDECGAFISYDTRLNSAAEAAGLAVHAPH